MSTHVNPFDRQVQLGIVHERTHVHASSSMTTSSECPACFHRRKSRTISCRCSICLYCGSFHCSTRNLMRLVLLDGLHKNFLHCWTPCPLRGSCILDNVVCTRFNLSAGLMEVWRYAASKTTPILLLGTLSWRTWVNASSATCV